MTIKKEIKKFFSHKYNFYREIPYTKENILMVDRQRYDSTVMNAILALAVNKKYKKNILILSDLKKDDFIIKYYKHLGFKKYLTGMNYFQILNHPYLFILSLFISTIGIINVLYKGYLWFINNYKIENIPIGDLIYDTNIRFHHRYIKLKIDYHFIKLLILSTFRALIILKYIRIHNIKKVIVGNESYSFNPGITLRIATFKNIKNYYPGRSSDKEIEIASDKIKSLYFGRDNIKNKKIKEKLDKFQPSKKDIKNFYLKRKEKLSTKYFWTEKSFAKANIESKEGKKFIEKILKIKKKRILYASHAFSDAAHQKGLIYSFKDFYDQFFKNLSNIKKNNDENLWIFRAHPSSLVYDEEDIFKKEVERINMKNVLICPRDVPIKKLYDICDVVITGSGTAGLEFICEGKQSILAGSAAYSNEFLTNYCAKNKNEYFKFLKNIKNLKKPTKQQILFGKKILFFFESGKFIIKKIPENLLKEDKIFKEFFLNFFGLGSNIKEYLNLTHNLLKKDINKSRVFKKMIDLV